MKQERIAELRAMFSSDKNPHQFTAEIFNECLDEITRLSNTTVWVVVVFKGGGKTYKIREIHSNKEKALEKKKIYNNYSEMCEVYPYTIV